MSVRNDHELPRSQADASDDAHTWTDQGPLEVQEAIESIVASLPVIAEHVSSIPDGQKATALDALERHYLQNRTRFGLFRRTRSVVGGCPNGSFAGAIRTDERAGRG